jgi:hypothetical protein
MPNINSINPNACLFKLVIKKLFNEDCTDIFMCDDFYGLVCDNITKKCSCDNEKFWYNNTCCNFK